jgi:hypothetical protein
MGTKRLEMIFKNQLGTTTKVSVENVKDDLTQEQVRMAMQLIIDRNIFKTQKGELTAIDSAKIVTTDVQEIIV